jgi:isopentenyldiphosphate isomerase
MELCDVVDQFGKRTGRVVTRGTKLASDEFYLAVHVWIRDESNQYLVQQRAFHLTSGPGVWSTTVGYVLSGEESIDGAIREVKEELGIQLLSAYLQRIERHVLDNRVEDIWMAEVHRDSIGIPAPGDEVADYKWVSRDELEQLADCGEFFRYSYHGKLF